MSNKLPLLSGSPEITNPERRNIADFYLSNRFLLTRLFFEISIGEHIDDGEIITDVKEVIEGEIWSVTTCSSTQSKDFYVLEATCEIIGQPPLVAGDLGTPTERKALRADWSAYVAERLHSKHARLPPLLDFLAWTNHEEYERGISKHWLKKTKDEGEVGMAKRIVAERYIMACVVGNRHVQLLSST